MTNQKRQISKGTVASAEPSEREYVVWDTAIQGFGLRVRPTGAKSFIYVYRDGAGRAGKVKRVTIKADNPEVARVKAKALASAYHGGGDPAADKAKARKSKTTVAAMLDRFLTDYVDRELKPKTSARLSEDCRENLEAEARHVAVADLAKRMWLKPIRRCARRRHRRRSPSACCHQPCRRPRNGDCGLRAPIPPVSA